MKSSQESFLPKFTDFFYILADRFRETIYPEVRISFSKELENINAGDDLLTGEVQFYVPNVEWLELIEGLLGPGLIPQENSDPRLILEVLIDDNRMEITNSIKESEFHRVYQSSTGKKIAHYLIFPQLYVSQKGSNIWYSEFFWPIHYQEGAGYYFANVYAGTSFIKFQYSAEMFQDWEKTPLLTLFRDPNIQLLSTWYSTSDQIVIFPRSDISPVPTNPELQMVWGINISLLYRS